MINIFTDPWIPSSPNGKLIGSLFSPVDANRILQIPLNNQGFEDFIAWKHTKHGRFTVKSAYHLQWRHNFGHAGSQLAMPGSSASNPVWKSLWQLKIPSKIKIFTWRALHGILPLNSILVNRHIGTSGQCPICSLDVEDILHLLFKCLHARELWEALGLTDIIDRVTVADRSGSSVLELLLTLPSNIMPGLTTLGLKEVIAVGCWYLWWLRRRRTHGESVPTIFKCRMSVLSIAANAIKASSAPDPRQVKWMKPEVRQVKINVDGSFHYDSFSGSTGVVARDQDGRFIAASTRYIPNALSPAAAEAMSMRDGLALANSLGCNNVVAESDSMEIIEACNGEEAWWSESSAVLASCIDEASMIGNVIFQYCPREANGVAHELARSCFSNKISCNWVDEPPNFLLEKLINDVTIV